MLKSNPWKIITNNFGFKLLALLFAFILWLVVNNIDDPTRTKTYTVKVDIVNIESLSNLGKCYEILDGTDTVTFGISAKRSYITGITDSNFDAVADLSDIQIEEDGSSAYVPIEITPKHYASNIKFTNSTKYLHIALEDLSTSKFVVQARTEGEVASGFALGDVTVQTPSIITVQGPASVVSQIENVVATIDITGMSMNFSDNVKPQFYDANGSRIETNRLSLSAERVTVSVNIQATKTVPLNFITTGTPAEGYEMTGVSANPSSITIQGSAETLGAITGIDVPSTMLNIQGATGNITSNIDITSFLPEGVGLIKGSETSIEVTVYILSDTTQSYNVKTENIKLIGLGEDYEASISQSTITVKVKGREDELKNITSASITGEIDLTDLGEGSHTVPVVFHLDTSIYTPSSVSVTVVISTKGGADEDVNEDNNSSNSKTEDPNSDEDENQDNT